MSLEKMDAFFNKRATTYDSHMLRDMQLAEFYQEIANCFPAMVDSATLLDLGCGTGLELERLYETCPSLCVTGIDCSHEMLNVLEQKFSGKKIKTICASYLQTDFGKERYHYVLSTYSLHHFLEHEKIKLYQKIYAALKPDGVYVEGDYTSSSPDLEQHHLAEYERICKTEDVKGGRYHLDIPFTAQTQVRLLKTAGFSHIRIVREWEKTTIIKAIKQ